MSTVVILIIIPIFLLILVGSIILQVVLSKNVNKWFGLILPIINFSIPILFLLFSHTKVIISTFLFSNFYTIIHLIIYFICRSQIKNRIQKDNMNNKTQLDKMKIQDL